METRLAGSGSSARVTGAYAGNGSQHLDFDTTQEHAAPNTTSDLAFRGVLEETATAVWRGMIRVDPGAQQTDAYQESRNLLLSKSAHADAIPGLEIEANDVRCTHARRSRRSTESSSHYLRSHGLADEQAKRLIIEGFLEALVERLDEGPIQGRRLRRAGAPSRRDPRRASGPAGLAPRVDPLSEPGVVNGKPAADGVKTADAPSSIRPYLPRTEADEGESVRWLGRHSREKSSASRLRRIRKRRCAGAASPSRPAPRTGGSSDLNRSAGGSTRGPSASSAPSAL